MKKVLVVFILLMLVVPAMATITVTATCSGTASPYTVTVSYATTGETLPPRAFGVLISCDANGTIGTVTPVTTNYYVAPGTFNYDGTVVTTWGNPIVPVVAGKSFILEVGSLYASNDAQHPTAPPLSGTLLTFPLTVPTGKSTVSIVVDSARGGVVREDPSVTGNVTLTGCTTTSVPNECMKSTAGTIYTNWTAVGKPACWCFQRNCRGDADGKIAGLYWVATPDLNCLRAGFNKTDAQILALPSCATGPVGMPAIYPICADFDHLKSGLYRVATPDLNILRAYFNKTTVNVPVCPMTNYNFWTN
jgi:hypothetical protein